MNKTKIAKVPTSVMDERKQLAKAFNIPQTKAFMLHDAISCEIMKQRKRKGRLHLDIKFKI